jgi:hypothetical protein
MWWFPQPPPPLKFSRVRAVHARLYMAIIAARLADLGFCFLPAKKTCYDQRVKYPTHGHINTMLVRHILLPEYALLDPRTDKLERHMRIYLMLHLSRNITRGFGAVSRHSTTKGTVLCVMTENLNTNMELNLFKLIYSHPETVSAKDLAKHVWTYCSVSHIGN